MLLIQIGIWRDHLISPQGLDSSCILKEKLTTLLVSSKMNDAINNFEGSDLQLTDVSISLASGTAFAVMEGQVMSWKSILISKDKFHFHKFKYKFFL